MPRKTRRAIDIGAELRKAARGKDQRKQELLTLALEIDADLKIARKLRTLPAESIRSLRNTRDDLLADAGLRPSRRNPAGAGSTAPGGAKKKRRRRPRHRYRCKVAIPRGKPITREFRALSDQAALSYCKGLLLTRLPKGAKPVSLKRLDGPAEKKKKPGRK